ncbi:transmembrane glycoprotein NMB [Sarotherodon galilaeus]
MSNRDSLGFGDLLPQDVVNIFAHERHSKKGRKKRTRSLGRALGWLKGKRRKNLSLNEKNPGLGPALDLALDGHPAGNQGGHKGGQKSGRQAHLQGNSHAALKLDDNEKTPAPPLFQENVFIESSRPKYLEDLHTEALQGLKMMQEEETNNGVEYQDSVSTISTMTAQTDGESAGFMTDSTIPDTSSVASVQSSVSTRSSRSGLTRQGSTFRPLNSGKKSEKTRTRRRHRKTVVGIPHHVQRELGLDRVDWTLNPKLDEEQLFNGETNHSPTTDGQQVGSQSEKGASINVPGISIIHPLNKKNVKQLGATHAGHRDDLALLHRLGPALEDDQRPRSLAVPWLTTASSLQQELPSPVMSMSPQAAYMSKIIPNAILPPAIDVVEISRGRSRNSVRTVSKSSLLLSSPAPSRASSRASSVRTTSSKSSTITSASRNNPPNLSDTSCWSNSDSSDTLVSDSSTISNSSTPRQKRNGNASAKEDKVDAHSSISKASTSNGRVIIRGDEVKKDGQFVRSLSVTKPKKAPPPPSRSYSLHSKMKRQPRYPAEIRVLPGEKSLHSNSAPSEESDQNQSHPYPSKTLDSPGYNADTSSLDDSMGSSSVGPFKTQLQAMKIENAKKVSKDASQEKRELLEESQDGTSPQLTKQPNGSSPKHKNSILAKLQNLFVSSSTKSESSKYNKCTEERKPDSKDTVSPSVQALIEIFNIPPPPKVHAPPPPPPEVWSHSLRSCELILGPPAPGKTYAIAKKNPKDRRQQRQSPSAAAEESAKSLAVERKHKNPSVTTESVNGSLHVLELKKVQESGILNAEIYKDSNERLAQNVDLNGRGKDEKGRVSDMLNGMLMKAVERREERLAAIKEEAANKTTGQATEVKTNTDKAPAISLVHISPALSAPLVQHVSQPLPRQTAEINSTRSVKVVSPESSWPPPPPPLAPVSPSGPDEIDFPLPPPPLFGDDSPNIPVQVPPKPSLRSDSSCTTASVISVVKKDSIKVITEPELQKSSTSQGVAPSPLNIPPPPPYTAPPPPLTEVLPAATDKVSLTLSPPPPVEFGPVIPKKPPSPVVQDVPPPVKDISSTLVTLVSPSPPKVVSPPLVVEVSHLPLKEVSAPSSEEVTSPCQENISNVSEETEPISKLAPPESNPPAPPLPSEPESSEQKTELLQENVSFEPEANTVSSNSVLIPPQNIPPPPPIELLPQPQVVAPKTYVPQTVEAPKTDVLTTKEASPSPPSEVSIPPPSPPETSSPEKTQVPAPSEPVNIPVPPPLPVQGHASIKEQPISLSTENKTQAQTSTPVVQEEPMPIVTPSLLQMVKLRSVTSSPETPKAEEQQPQAEVTSSSQFPSSSANGEAPQKPIRKSLIMTSSTPIPPLETGPSQPTVPKSQADVVPPASLSIATSPTKKAYSAVNTNRSMNLQEAIRMRTAARSQQSPASRLSLQPPTSPLDLHKSPSSTASFIFSKSNRNVVTETKPVAKEDVQKKVTSEAESMNKGAKVPPPVAKKPKTKGNEVETSEDVDQTAKQEAQQESIADAAEKTNGTAGTVEEGSS